MVDWDDYPSRLMEEIRAVLPEIRALIEQAPPQGAIGRDLQAAYARRGFHALLVPESLGGRGFDFTSSGLAYEILSYELPGTLYGTLTTAHCCFMIMSGMRNACHKETLRRISGPDHSAAFCLTEKDAGSDIGAIKTRAEKTGGGYILSGRKAVVINHAAAATYVVFATIPPAKGRAALSAFVVEAASAGIQSGDPFDTHPLAGDILGPVTFEGVKVPNECLLGEPGSGYLLFMETLDKGRPLVAACCTGEGQRAFDVVLDHVKARTQFSRPLFAFQDISFCLAEHATRLKAARLLWQEALARIDSGKPFTQEASMSKLFASQTLSGIASFAREVLGHRLVSRDHPQARLLDIIGSDARFLEIIDGTPAVQKMVIASQL